jgi:hypothetical protein
MQIDWQERQRASKAQRSLESVAGGGASEVREEELTMSFAIHRVACIAQTVLSDLPGRVM